MADRTSPLGRAIRAERTRRNLTRRTLADRTGMTEGNLARVELYGQEPSLTTLQAIAGALGVSTSSLIEVEADRTAS